MDGRKKKNSRGDADQLTDSVMTQIKIRTKTHQFKNQKNTIALFTPKKNLCFLKLFCKW